MSATPRRLRPSQPEAHLLAAIRIALGRTPDLVLWRNATGAGTADDGRHLRFGLVKGGSDLVGLLAPTGRWIALEVKTPTGRVTQEQELFLQLVRNHGGFGAVVRSVADAEAALSRARAGRSA